MTCGFFKELGDVENWTRCIERDLREVCDALCSAHTTHTRVELTRLAPLGQAPAPAPLTTLPSARLNPPAASNRFSAAAAEGQRAVPVDTTSELSQYKS